MRMIPIECFPGLYLELSEELHQALIDGRPVYFASESESPFSARGRPDKAQDTIGIRKVCFIGIVARDTLLSVQLKEGNLTDIKRSIFRLEWLSLAEIHAREKLPRLY